MKLKNAIFCALGFIFTALAFLGVVLPVLPTTPFLLLAVFFFARSSQRWHNYLLNHRIFGQYLRDYYNHEMTIVNKWRTLVVMWLGMGICMWLLREKIWLVVLLIVIAVGVTIHLCLLKSVRHKRCERGECCEQGERNERSGRSEHGKTTTRSSSDASKSSSSRTSTIASVGLSSKTLKKL